MKSKRILEPIVCISRSAIKGEAISEALNGLPINNIIKDGDHVVITPNWVKAKPANTGTVVGPQTLRELIKYIKKLNPRRITVACGSGGDETQNVFNKVGYKKVIEEEKIEFIDLNYGPYEELFLKHNIIKATKINSLIKEVDVLISFSQLKVHEEATISGTVKNIALGWPPAEIHGFPKKKLGIHEDLHGFIAAITKEIPIDLAILSVDKAMIGTGPSDGKPVNTQGLIIASTDAIAADAIGARLLGFLPQAVSYIYQLHKEGIGEADPKNMLMKGLSLEEAEKIFSLAAYNQEIVLDKNNQIKNLHGNQ
ncbi:DUF362 domain-containing protein [Alkaliphilus peptidifermentans]|uniref:Uncharacterized conserved protein, DUF362 family n=1 Tax=Alkaliphilus peptidifermentans DSM 18978 TaxID=1120976 RepID=A0A1G5K2Z4_9FIRM|nr:DUF362 domain-containing protein [Alkaliphilus peptidifermentans]SCY94571.1 Uncharacterized conserved protein, DUF362 family [Alkaliphilus peptidifermentans DSM 18978]